jgi:hypothetical protein
MSGVKYVLKKGKRMYDCSYMCFRIKKGCWWVENGCRWFKEGCRWFGKGVFEEGRRWFRKDRVWVGDYGCGEEVERACP